MNAVIRSGEVSCFHSYCSKIHHSVDLEPFKKPVSNSEDYEATMAHDNGCDRMKDRALGATGQAQLNCDKCKEEISAVCYCVDCDRKLCSKHEAVSGCELLVVTELNNFSMCKTLIL